MKKPVVRWIMLIIILVVVVGVAVFVVAPRVTAQMSAQTEPADYQTARVQKGDLTATIGAAGLVRSKQSSVLVWQTSGVVGQVNVTRGQLVKSDAVLAELKQTSLPQAVILARANLVTAQKNLDTLLNTSVARANAELAVAKAQKALDDAQKARNNMQFQRASEETIEIAKANLILATKAMDDATTFFGQHQQRTGEDVVYAAALSQYAAASQRLNRSQYNYNYVTGLPDPLDIQTADATIDVAQATLLSAKQDWDRVKDGPNDQDVAAARAQVDAAQAILNLASMSAPFDGTVTVVNSKVGDQIAPATTAFQIDDLSHLYVDMDVSEVDIARVHLGQAVDLTFDALPGKSYQGVVSDLAVVGKTVSGSVFFTVTVEITTQTADIHPGMTATASITSNELKGGLLVPQKAIKKQDGVQVVYLLKGGQAVPVTVKLGTSSANLVQVTAGAIKEGDLVILNPPTQPSAGTNNN